MFLPETPPANTTAVTFGAAVRTFWPVVAGLAAFVGFFIWGWTKATLENRKLALEVESLRRNLSAIQPPSPAEIEKYGAKRPWITLQELLVMVVIIGSLSAIAIPKFASPHPPSRLERLKADSAKAVRLQCVVDAVHAGVPLDTAETRCPAKPLGRARPDTGAR